MSTTTAVETRQERRLRLAEKARQIDEAAAGAMELFHGAEVSTEKELALACAVVDLRGALTAEVMEPIMSLMNSPLGFLTDKDPSKPVQKDGKWETPKPYAVETVRDCVIAAKMLGFRVVGNEMNIISGKFYPAKAGFRRKLTDGQSFPGLTDFRDSYDPPRMGANGALVKCRASWKRNGKPDSVEFEFAIRNNAGMGADAILGKAERKLCKRVHDLLLGMTTPDADMDADAPTVDVKATPVQQPQPRFNAPATAVDPEPPDDVPMDFPKKEAAAPAAEAQAPAANAAATSTEASPAGDEPAGGPEMTPAQAGLADLLETSGIAFDDFRDWVNTTGRATGADAWSGIEAVPDAVAQAILADKKGVSRLKIIHGKK